MLSLLWVRAVPFDHAPDELLHFNADWYIADHGSLPILDRSPDFVQTQCDRRRCTDTYATAPPGAMLLGAGFIRIQQWISATHLVAHTPAEVGARIRQEGSASWWQEHPYDPFITAARLSSTLCVVLYALFLYLLAAVVLESSITRLSVLYLGALVPQITFIGAYVNDDAFGLCSATATLFAAALIRRNGLSPRGAVFCGIAVGCVILSKPNYWATAIVFVLCAGLRLRQERYLNPLRRSGVPLAIALTLAFAVSGWWFVRNALLYGDPIGLAASEHAMNRVMLGYSAHHSLAAQHKSLAFLFLHTGWPRQTFESYWGFFDYLLLPLSRMAYLGIGVVLVLALLGLLRGCRAAPRALRRLDTSDDWRVQITAIYIGLFVAVTLLSAWSSLVKDYQAQGRYLFAAAAPVALLLGIGIQRLCDRVRTRALALGAIAVGMVCLNLYALLFVVARAYRGL